MKGIAKSIRNALYKTSKDPDVVAEVAPEGTKAQMARLALLEALSPFCHFGTSAGRLDQPCKPSTSRQCRELHRLILDECGEWECAQGY